MRPRRALLPAIAFLLLASRAGAQWPERIAIMEAEDRRAPDARDLAVIRRGVHSRDVETAVIAVRALGRLERPALIPDIAPSLRSPMAEVRAEAANALGQAAQPLKNYPPNRGASPVDSALGLLASRLKVDDAAEVRAAIDETIGRLPYATAAQAARAEAALLETFQKNADSIPDRLGVAKGFEAFSRITKKLRPLGPDAVAALGALVAPDPPPADPTRDERVRRLALESLASADRVDDRTLARAADDEDAQVRRIAMRVAAAGHDDTGVRALTRGLADASPMVRWEALRSLHVRDAPSACAASLAAVADTDVHVALIALDQLASCGSSPDAVAALDHAVTDLSDAGSPRGWHRAAHAIVALASADPGRAAATLGQLSGSSIWQLRMYAARAAAILEDRPTLERLAADGDDNVCETAVGALSKLAGHAADRLYMAALARSGNQAIRAGALALPGSTSPGAVRALEQAWQRLVKEGSDNSHDARDAIAGTLAGLGAPVKKRPPPRPIVPEFDAADLQRLQASRARVTIRGLGTFDLALFATEAPATVLRFARLAERGYYNGLTFHRVVPNFVIQGGSPGASEYVGDRTFMRDELGLWPHVRGAVGISTRGRDTGDAQIFVDLVDNPRLDHEYTVFAQVLNGIDVVDRILEGDVIEKIEIVPGA